MTAIKDKQLEGKIQNRLERLGISNLSNLNEKEGASYLRDVLYVLLSDDSFDDISEIRQKVANEREVPLYKLQTCIALVINVANEEVLKSFYKAEEYNLKMIDETILLIADDILMRD